MNWLTNTVLPKFNLFARRKDSPDNLWEKCAGCGQMAFHRELERTLQVCPHCRHHMRIGPEKRFKALFDDGEYQTVTLPESIVDPLKFRDSKRYVDRLKDSRGKTGINEAVAVATGQMAAMPVVMVAQSFAFMGGSMGTAAGEAVVVAAEQAVAMNASMIAICASGGMRMQEGILSLMQMPRTTIAVQRLREAGLPYIVVLTDPTTGGVTASFAMLGDVTMAEPNALIGFAGPRIIEQTIHERLPEGFQRAEFLLDHGMIDLVVPRAELRDTLIRAIDLLRNRAAAPAEETVAAEPTFVSSDDIGSQETAEEDQDAASATGDRVEPPNP